VAEDALVAPHVCGRLEDGGPDEVAIRITRYLDIAAIKEDLPTFFLTGRDKTSHALLCRGRDEWATNIMFSGRG
jgi:hypothetical protein